jgi:outer membrane protein assembly factor BamA
MQFLPIGRIPKGTAVKANAFRHYIVRALGLMISFGFPIAAGATSIQRMPTLQRSKMAVQTNKEKESDLSASLSMGYKQSLIDHQDGSKSESAGGSFSLSYQMLPTWSVSAGVDYDQNLKDPEDTDNGISDLSIGFKNKSHSLASWVDGTWSLSAEYPMSEDSLKITNFQGSLGTKYRLSLTSTVLPKGWDASTALSVTRSFYKYETSTKGTVLNPYSISESASLGYSIKRWSFSVSGKHAHRFDFDNHISERLLHTEEIGFDVVPKRWSMAVGHTNRTSWFSQLDEDANLDFINEDSSKIYAQTEISF